MPLKDQVFKRLSKKAKRGMRGWPLATIAFYGPDASRATKVVVSIVPSEDAEPSEMRDWQIVHGDVAEEAGYRSGDVGIYGWSRREVGRYV